MADGFQAEAFLVEVLGADVVQRRGDELIHPCLIMPHEHDSTEPGASLHVDKLLYNCFKCGSGGTLLWLTQVVLGVGSSEARRIIEGKFIQVARSPQAFLQELEAGWSRDVSRTMPKFNAKMLDPWLCYTRYMDERGISHEVQKKMMTGLNRDNKDDVGGTWVVQPRLVIPHFFGGRLRGWSMRKLSSEQLGPKYKHTGEFPKRNTLYNWDNAVAFDSVIVTESPMSVLGLMSKGIENVVATFGAEVNDEQLDLIAKFGEATMFPDGDSAGYRSLRRDDRRGNDVGSIQALITKMDLYVVDHSPGGKGKSGWNEKDPADYTDEEVRNLLANRIPAYLWGWKDDEDGIRKVDKGKAVGVVSHPDGYYD